MLPDELDKELVDSILNKKARIISFTTDVDIMVPNCSTDFAFNKECRKMLRQVGGEMFEYRSEEGSQHRNKITGLPINVEMFRSPNDIDVSVQRFHAGQVRHFYNGKFRGLPSALATATTGINYIDRSCKSKNPDKSTIKLIMLHASRGFATPTNIRKTLLVRAILAGDPDYRDLKEVLTMCGTLDCHPQTIIFHEYMSKYGIIMRRISELYAEILTSGVQGLPPLPHIDQIYLKVPQVDMLYNTPYRLEKSDMFKGDHLIYPS